MLVCLFKCEFLLSATRLCRACVFQAVCDELGAYYQQFDCRYARSGPHLTKKLGDIKLKLGFWSSRTNLQGESVALEIFPEFESMSLAKHLSKMEKVDGFILGHTEVFHKSIACYPECDVVVRFPFAEELKRSDPNYRNLLIYSNYVNVYRLTTANFVKLVNYLNRHVFSMFDILQDEALLESFLFTLPEEERKSIVEHKATNSKLLDYLQFKFPKLAQKFASH